MPKSYSIVAMNYAKSEDFVKSLAVGTAATLVREPTNQHDANAVAVYIEGRKVGYIPAKQNKVLAQFIDQAGKEWFGPKAGDAAMAVDETPGAAVKAIDGTFIRSPNSSYPMVEVVE